MRIDEILKKKRTLSFEVFPPKKNEADRSKIFATIDELKTLSPDFISVTYGAGDRRQRELPAYEPGREHGDEHDLFRRSHLRMSDTPRYRCLRRRGADFRRPAWPSRTPCPRIP